jgi:hypothetical protein
MLYERNPATKYIGGTFETEGDGAVCLSVKSKTDASKKRLGKFLLQKAHALLLVVHTDSLIVAATARQRNNRGTEAHSLVGSLRGPPSASTPKDLLTRLRRTCPPLLPCRPPAQG